MRLTKRSRIRQLISMLRFAIAKLWHYRQLKSPWFGMVDCGCSIFVVGKKATIAIGKHFSLGKESEIQSRGKLIIGNHVYINRNSRIVCFEEISIGDNCLFAANVTVLDHDHMVDSVDGDMKRENFATAPIQIGNGVWVGEKVTILKGVSIGENSVIAAHAVVSRDVPANCIVGGLPAKFIRKLNH